MKKLLALVALVTSLGAHAAPASEESVERLLAATNAEALMPSLYAGMDQMMRQTLQHLVKGKSLTAEQQRALDALPSKFVSVMKDEMSWQKLKPKYIQLYRETFEQEEVDGLLAFYASPAGQAMITKMPVVMQKSFAISQSMMQSMLPKLEEAVKAAMAEAKSGTAK